MIALAVSAAALTALYDARAALEERAQASLSTNVAVMKEFLAQRGQPRREGDVLSFGGHAVNNDHAIVDQVKAITGGVASIFSGDVR